MKKLLLLSFLAVTFQLVQAQDLKKVQATVLLNKIADAKTEIDKIMADPKQNTKPEVLFWNAKISAAIYKDEALRAKYPNAEQQADEAIKKYAAADPTFAQVTDKGSDMFFDMYSTNFAQGVKVFNEKKWPEAAKAFEASIVYIDQIIKNKWSTSNIAFDTTALLYAGYAQQNASKKEAAIKNYIRLADGKVTGKDYIDVYRYLILYYIETKDEANFNKYLALARQGYPNEPWDDFEIEYMDKNYDLAKKTEIYTKEDAAGTLNESKYLQFGDLFIGVKNKEKGNLDSAQIAAYTMRAADAFKKAYSKNDKNAIAAFNVGVIYYNIFGDYDDKYGANIKAMQAINANKPVEKDPKKKAALEAKIKEQTDVYKNANLVVEKPLNENLDAAIEWLEKTFVILKDKPTRSNVEKNVINKTVDFLTNLYGYKRDRVRAKDPKAFDAFEAKFKEYDALHGKY